MHVAEPIAVISEDDATGEIAVLYEDLRVTLGVPFVNLIWRHLATIPGGLASTWTLVKPLYQSGVLDRPASNAHGLVSFATLAPIPAFVWDSLSIDRRDRQVMRRLIEDYNHANGVNFLALLVAVSVARDGLPASRTSAPAEAAVKSPRPVAPAAPRMLGMSELSPPLSKLVHELDGLGRLGTSAAIASLYRHLAHWPGFLAMAYASLAPLHRSGDLAGTQQRVIDFGRQQSAELRTHVNGDLPPLTAEAKTSVIVAIDEFTRLMIGRMVVLGNAMRGLMPQGE